MKEFFTLVVVKIKKCCRLDLVELIGKNQKIAIKIRKLLEYVIIDFLKFCFSVPIFSFYAN